MPQSTNKTIYQIISLCIGFLGIQIGFALQAGNVTRILQNFGADLTQVSLFWLIAPLCGALVQPLIGYLSDRHLNKGNTRVPYLLFGSFLCSLALFALPNADILIGLGAPLLIGGILIIIIDISFNISMHPLRAAITDYVPIYQQSRGFAVQTFLISIGAILGSTLPYILHEFLGLKTISIDNQISENVKWSFYIGSSILLLCILITSNAISKNTRINQKVKAESKGKTFYIPQIPHKMWKLSLIQFFSWAAFFLIWIYMTPALSQHFYKEFDYSAKSTDYASAANYTGVVFGIYHFSASLFAIALPYLYKRITIINTHIFALSIGGIGLLWVYNCNDVSQLYLPMLCIGIAWGSILASPFALLSRFIPSQKIGLYFGLFNLSITIPQILVGLCSGIILETFFDGEAVFALVFASCFLFLAAFSALAFRKSLRL